MHYNLNPKGIKEQIVELELVYEGRLFSDAQYNGLFVSIHKNPAFDCIRGFCRTEGCPGYPLGHPKSHGRGNADYFYMAKGEGLVTVFSYFSDEPHPSSPPLSSGLVGFFPHAYNISWHSRYEIYEGMSQHEDCEFLGSDCFFDTRYLEAEDLMNLIRTNKDNPDRGNQLVFEHLGQLNVDLTKLVIKAKHHGTI